MSIVMSLVIYMLCLFPPIVFGFVGRRFSRGQRVLVYLASFSFTFVFAALRASDVGTDTRMYLDYFEVLAPREAFGLDPLFYLLQITIKSFGGGFHVFLLLQALFCWVGFSVGAAFIDRDVPLLGVGLLPVIMLDSTFNGLRYGMAFAATLLVIVAARRSHTALRMALYAIPGLIHSSMLLLLLATAGGIAMLVAGAAVVAANPALVHIGEYFLYKGAAYEELERSSWFSGIVPVIQILLILTVARMTGAQFKAGINLFCLALVLAIVSIVVGFYSMSALRLIQVALFLLTIAVSQAVPEHGAHRNASLLVVMLGAMGALNLLRQIFLVGPAGNVLFAPYNFY